ncbi:MAG TPA: nucleotidyltransferase [Edaphobacter sp.]|nr:nucleotidyltransferase [Edaphobacter sp.]
MEQNLRELLFALNRHGVKYVIIGGYAVFIHAQPRMTKDLDVFIESSPANALALYKALAEFGASLAEFTVEDFHTPTICARFGNPPYCFDVLQQIAGIDFATVYANSEELLIDGDLPARFISAADLITNKLASGRLQDLADVEAIRHSQRSVKST